MKFILIESRYLTESTDYRKKAIQELVNSGLYDKETATAIVDDDIRTNQVGIIRHNNWMTKMPLMIVKKMLKYAENKQNKHQAIINFEDQFNPAISKLLEIKNAERSKLSTKQEQENFSAQFNQEFDNMSIEDIQELADEIARKNKEESDAELANMKFDKESDYDLIPIDSYEQMNQLFGGIATGDGNGRSEWCHTNGKDTYNSWINNNKCRFFVLAKKNWKDIKFNAESNAQNPKDEYGNSLIAILVRRGSNNLLKATLRCNHIGVPTNADNQYSKYSELSKIAGFNVEEKINEVRPKKEIADIKTLYKLFDGTYYSLDKILDKANMDRGDLTKFIIPDSVTEIGDEAFLHCGNLSSITIPDSIIFIGDSAFENCYGLKEVNIPDSVLSIGRLAFENCHSLETVTIPNSVTSIGYNMFSDCSSLKNITLSNSFTSIMNGMFANCDSLSNITIPNSVTTIENGAFSGCSSLKNITIPNSVSTIGAVAFESCSMEEITLPDSVTYIGKGAFRRCKNLNSIIIPDSVTTIEDRAFIGCPNVTVYTKNPIAINYCQKNDIPYVEN